MSRSNYKNLSRFIEKLEAEGELVRIHEKVSPVLEITEITDRVSKSKDGGKALLFENVEGSDMPLLINAYGSDKRMAMALGVDSLEEIADQVDSLLHMAPPDSIMDKIKMLPVLFDLAKCPPKKISGSAPCQEVVMEGDDADLSILPVLKCWPGDAGRFVTFPLVFTKGLNDGKRNLGMYRLQIFDKNTTGMHWHIHKDGAHQFHEYKRAGKKMPVAVAIGSDPAVTYSATAPLPRGVDELILAGLIRGKPVNLVKCKTVDLYVPAEAEIILEGYVDPAEDFRMEGPFGDHTGYYSLADQYPQLHLTAITHRKNPTYFTTIVGKPPMEDCYMANATSRIFLPMLKTVVPEIRDYDLPWEGVFHNCVIVDIEKEFPGGAQRVMNAMWGTGQMSFAKMILAVDSASDITDYKTVFKLMLNNVDITKDLFFSEGILDVLDHSAPEPLHGSKLGIDATSRFKGEKQRSYLKLDDVDEPLLEKAFKSAGALSFNLLGKDCRNRIAVISVDKKGGASLKKTAEAVTSSVISSMFNIFVFVDGDIDTTNLSAVTWKFFNNTDPGRDINLDGKNLIIDSTKKLPSDGHDRAWPDDIEMDNDTKAKVDAIWPKLGIDK